MASAAAVLVLGALGASPALAASPAWRISDQAVPGALPPGGTGHLELQVQNIGNVATSGPVTVVDRLPAGVTATAADGLQYESGGRLNFQAGNWDCTIEPGPEANSVVECANDPTETNLSGHATFKPSLYNGAGLDNYGCALNSPEDCASVPGYRAMVPPIGIAVSVDPTAEEGALLSDAAEVSGGGAPAPAADHSTISVSAEPTPFGIAGAHQWAIEPDGSPDTQAGSHPYALSTAVQFNLKPAAESGYGAGALRNVHAELPPGFVGNPDATPKCSQQAFDERIEFGYPQCPPDSQVGVAEVEILGSNFYADLPIYNLVPYRGEPARFGFAYEKFTAFLNAGVRSGQGYNLAVDIHNLARRLPLSFADLTFWGVPADPTHDGQRGECAGAGIGSHANCSSDAPLRPFITLPTHCGQAQPLSISAEAWEGDRTNPGPLASGPFGIFSSDEQNNPVTLDGCNRLEFSPSIKAQPTTNAADSPTGFDVDLHVPQPETVNAIEAGGKVVGAEPGLAESHLKDSVVTLPAGLSVNPSSANGLGACSEAEIALQSPEPATCPASSKLGTVEVETPLLDHPLPGSVYIANPFANPFNSLLAIYIAVDDPISGVVVKLPGKVEADPVSGQLKATFSENPQLPFEDFKLDFFGGPTAPLKTAATCGSFTTTSDLTPWSSPEVADANPSDSFEVSHGANGGACASSEAALPNKPSFSAGTVTPQAGAYSPFTLKLNREDGTQLLKGLDFTLPPGLSAKLAGVAECSNAQIAAAEARSGAAEQAAPSCPAASEIGTITVGAGAGPTPFYATGHAYLAGPYKGAPLSLISIVPALAGPFDLGVVGDRTALYVNPETAQVHAVTDTIPHILKGIPLDLRSIAVQLSRSDFTLNPTNCEKHSVLGSATSLLGSSASLTSPFQVGECAKLGFKPKFAIKLKGGTKRNENPALSATVTYPKGAYANIAKASVALPHSEFLDQSHIKTICTRVQFAEGNTPGEKCPAASIYGFAKAETPLLDKPVEGPVYLRSSSHNLPDLVAALNGQISVDLDGRIDTDKQDGIRNSFEVVPDAPVSKFALSMKGGKKGLLVNSENICRKPQRATVKLVAQNGKVDDSSPLIANGCKKSGKGKKGNGHKKGAKRSSARLQLGALPSGW